ncbi:MAG: lysine--tRNA ligase [Candidatus Buchananbacteria bacterium]|nr:lysine--tRNA ligase [Candidatus Buchananbacteria bacterium]
MLNDEYQTRLQKLKKIAEQGINPFPDKFDKTHSISDALTSRLGAKVKTAGRILTLRDMGKISFGHIQDASGKIQIVLKQDEIGKEEFKSFLKIFDPGDFIGVEGEIFKTQKGEISILVKTFVMLAKALRPLPEKWHGIKDQELKYRQRYLDLISDKTTYDRFVFRSNFIRALREFYWQEGFIELETPILTNTASGALAKPFKTHHNALDIDVYLRIAPETYLKEAVVGGFEKVFELGRLFRNEGIDPSHLQDYTSVEHYVAYWNYEDNMRFTEKLFGTLLKKLFGTTTVTIKDRTGQAVKVDFKPPFKTVSFRDLILKDSGIDIDACKTVTELRTQIKKKKIALENVENLGRGNLIDALYKEVSRPKIIQPTFVINHPVDVSPLARRNDQNPAIVDRFQLVINTWEVVNAYSELVDPVDQKNRFETQAKAKAQGDDEAHGKDDDFVRALEHGAPPMSGWGMGVDRLITLLSQQDNLRDVVLFPLLRPEK